MTNKNTDDKPTFFVSRRGRKVGVHEVDLAGIDIDHDSNSDHAINTPVESTKPVKTTKTAAPVKTSSAPNTPRAKRTWTKKKSFITVIVLSLLLLPLVAVELVAAEYSRGSSQAKADLSSLVSTVVLPAQKDTTISADQIRSIANRVNDTVGRMCRGGFLDNVAGLYPRASTELRDCKTTQAHYASLANNLYALESQARYLERVDAFMKPVATPITDEFAVIGAQQKAWQSASDGISKLSPPSAMKTAHAELSSHVSAVVSGWSKLNTANNDQDATAFQDAEKALATEYQAVRETSLLFSAVLSDSQAKINSSYGKLK